MGNRIENGRRRVREGRLVSIVCLSLFAVACSPSHPEAVAYIDSVPVLREEFQEFLARSVGSEAAGLQSEALSALLDQYLEERLLLQLALDRRVVERGADSRAALVALLDDQDHSVPGAAEIESYYRDHREEFALPERVELFQVLVESREAAEQARTALDSGADFTEVARRLSVDPSAPSGGFQGELARNELPTALADTIFDLEVGTPSEIVEADFRFHIFYVARRLPAEQLDLEAAEPLIRERLVALLADQRFEELLREARERYDLRIVEGNLAFSYRPRDA